MNPHVPEQELVRFYHRFSVAAFPPDLLNASSWPQRGAYADWVHQPGTSVRLRDLRHRLALLVAPRHGPTALPLLRHRPQRGKQHGGALCFRTAHANAIVVLHVLQHGAVVAGRTAKEGRRGSRHLRSAGGRGRTLYQQHPGTVCHTGLEPRTSRAQAGLLLTRSSLALDRRLERAGLRARDCHAVGVELRPVWGTHLPALAPQVQRRYGTATLPTFHQPYAASTCDGARLGTTNPNPNPSSNPNPDPDPNPNSDQVLA